MGTRRASPSSAARSSHASTAARLHWVIYFGLDMDSGGRAPDWPNNWRTAGGMRGGEWFRFARRSRRPSMCWKGCWRTSAQPAAHRRSIAARRRGGKRISSNESCSTAKAQAKWSNPEWLQFSFPIRWHYDVLRALEYFRSVGDAPDSRVDEAMDWLRSSARPSGVWLLENTHPGKVHFELEDGG